MSIKTSQPTSICLVLEECEKSDSDILYDNAGKVFTDEYHTTISSDSQSKFHPVADHALAIHPFPGEPPKGGQITYESNNSNCGYVNTSNSNNNTTSDNGIRNSVSQGPYNFGGGPGDTLSGFTIVDLPGPKFYVRADLDLVIHGFETPGGNPATLILINYTFGSEDRARPIKSAAIEFRFFKEANPQATQILEPEVIGVLGCEHKSVEVWFIG